MMEEVHQAASSRITRVLLLGPTGVGKTFIAEEIHRLSRSSPEKFAAPNCGNPSAEAQYLELFGGLMMNFRETRLGAFGRRALALSNRLTAEQFSSMRSTRWHQKRSRP